MTELRVLLLAQQLRRSASGGIGTYLLGLLQGLDQLAVAGEAVPGITLAASRPPAGTDPLLALGRPLQTSVLPAPVLTRAWDHRLVRAPATADLVHAASLATLDPGGRPMVTTVHDLLWRRIPEAYPDRGRRWHEAALRRALRRTDHFIVPADVVADDLMAAGAQSDSVTVVPMGADHLPPPDFPAAADHLASLGVTGPFLLSVGTLEPRKNLQRLVEAYGLIRDRLPEPWPLVMVGPSGWGAQVGDRPGVIHAGTVSPAALSGLYASARLLAYVPLIEGFGLPPVEAMAVGTPVVASPLPSTEGAAFEVDPMQIDAIAEGLLTVASDETLRSALVARGTARAAALTWASIAARHCAIWQSTREASGH